jgi:hypothetical protein
MAAPLPSDLNDVDPFDAWKPWLPAKNEWSRKWAAHLFRRAAFGAKPVEINRALAEGFPKTLERLLVGAPDANEVLELFTEIGQYCKETANLRMWWLRFMVEGGHPLREKLTLFWHNHFATSIAKVREIKSMFEQNVTLRKHALGKFGPFLLEMSKNPAILVWLDSNQNVKEAPNENYARELMELFSLGVGNYTEKDIREAARAFTGWHTNSAPNGEEFEYNPLEHDEGSKTVFGRTGNWNGEDIVRLCCDRPACAKFLVGKLYTFFVSETPPPKGLLTPLEEQFRKSDYNIADLVKTMLGSQLFFSAHAYRKRVKWPVEYAIEAFRSVIPGRMPLPHLVDSLASMGQVLFAPPNVKGWRTGTDWLNSATLLARNNLAERIALGGEGATEASSQTAKLVPTPVLPGTPVAPVVSSTSLAPPPPPDASADPITTLFASEPKDAATLVKQTGELLYGERLSPTHAAKIEKFLREPLLVPRSNPATSIPAPSPRLPGPVPAQPASSASPLLPITPIKPLKADQPELAPPPREVIAKPGKFDLEAPEFKARVREALHAMMCLPEYQLN